MVRLWLLSVAGRFALYIANLQKVGSWSVHLESKNFILCNPQKKPVQHLNFNINFTYIAKTVCSREGTPEFTRLLSVIPCPSHSSGEQSRLRARGHLQSGQSPAPWRHGDHSSHSPWSGPSRHWLHSLRLHRFHPRWNSRAPVHRQSLDSEAPWCETYWGKHSDLSQQHKDLNQSLSLHFVHADHLPSASAKHSTGCQCGQSHSLTVFAWLSPTALTAQTVLQTLLVTCPIAYNSFSSEDSASVPCVLAALTKLHPA